MPTAQWSQKIRTGPHTPLEPAQAFFSPIAEAMTLGHATQEASDLAISTCASDSSTTSSGSGANLPSFWSPIHRDRAVEF